MATKATTTKKTITTKTAVVKKSAVKAPGAKPAKTVASVSKNHGMSVPVVALSGESKSEASFIDTKPFEKVSASLIAQAIRVYQSRQHQGTHSTKTRGEVSGSTRKLFKQKGTGRARHGSIKAPIFVGGGIALGPRPSDPSLSFPKSMQQRAFAAVLTDKVMNHKISIISGADSMSGKTKDIVALLAKLDLTNSKVLIIVDPKQDMFKRAVRNLSKACTASAHSVSMFDLLRHETVLVTEEAIAAVQKRLPKTVSV